MYYKIVLLIAFVFGASVVGFAQEEQAIQWSEKLGLKHYHIAGIDGDKLLITYHRVAGQHNRAYNVGTGELLKEISAVEGIGKRKNKFMLTHFSHGQMLNFQYYIEKDGTRKTWFTGYDADFNRILPPDTILHQESRSQIKIWNVDNGAEFNAYGKYHFVYEYHLPYMNNNKVAYIVFDSLMRKQLRTGYKALDDEFEIQQTFVNPEGIAGIVYIQNPETYIRRQKKMKYIDQLNIEIFSDVPKTAQLQLVESKLNAVNVKIDEQTGNYHIAALHKYKEKENVPNYFQYAILDKDLKILKDTLINLEIWGLNTKRFENWIIDGWYINKDGNPILVYHKLLRQDHMAVGTGSWPSSSYTVEATDSIYVLQIDNHTQQLQHTVISRLVRDQATEILTAYDNHKVKILYAGNIEPNHKELVFTDEKNGQDGIILSEVDAQGNHNRRLICTYEKSNRIDIFYTKFITPNELLLHSKDRVGYLKL